MKALALAIGLCVAGSAVADAGASLSLGPSGSIPVLSLSNGQTLHNVVIVAYGSSTLMARWEGGQGTIAYALLPPEIRGEIERARLPVATPSPGASTGVPTGYTAPDDSISALVQARRGFSTRLIRLEQEGYPPAQPPEGVLDLVSYPGPLGPMAAYVSPRIADGALRPAIIWLVGGPSGSISPVAWELATPDNDQSASGFRALGIVTMYPSLRGGNQNPGHHERFYGEVDDVIAAARFLARRPGIDPHRIYLGGHSTGGTLALLVAESSSLFRAVFSLGPFGDMSSYVTREDLPFDPTNPTEQRLRSPKIWLDSIRVPTFVYEGAQEPSNLEYLQEMAKMNHNPLVRFSAVPGGTHFSIVAPMVRSIGKQIIADVAR